jgi:hypothetical protein
MSASNKFNEDVAFIAQQMSNMQDRMEELEDALQTSTTMLEALLVQLESWGHASAVNARGQIWNNDQLLEKRT